MSSMKSRAKMWKATDHNELPVIIPYNQYSKGGRGLASALDVYFYRNNTGWKVDPGTPLIYINWGGGGGDLVRRLEQQGHQICSIVNPPQKVNRAGNKLQAFEAMKDKVSIPEFTNSFETAIEWVESGIEVLGRRLRGSCGSDIVFYNDDLERFTNSDFWVKYKKKKDEFRVHVAFGKIIDVQRKALRTTDAEGRPINTANVDYRIRNLRNGFIFRRFDITVPNVVIEQAKNAVEALELDFGAVDVIYNETEGRGYVLEVNTAPGLEGTTLDNYAGAFREELSKRMTPRRQTPEATA